MKTKFSPSQLCALLLVAFLAPNIAQAEVDAPVRDALALVESGRAKEAYAMLEPLEVTRAGDPDFDTVFGIAANQSGEYVRAVMALERVTTVQPGNTRARAELGRAMFAVGDSKSARTLLEQAKAQGAPPEAALTIDQFLRAIDVSEAQSQSSWRGYVETSVGHDTNVSNGPQNANIAVPALGGNVTLARNAVKVGANFVGLSAGLSGRYIVDSRWSVIGNASANRRVNINEGQFNNNQFDLSAGGAYRLERQELSAVAVYQDYTLNGSLNRTQRGVVGEWAYRIDGAREMGAYLQYSKLHYPGISIRDSTRTVLGGSYAQQFGDGLLAWGGVYFGEEDVNASTVPYLGHSMVGLRTGLQKAFNPTLAAYVALSYESRNYGGVDPLFLVKRNDDQTTLSLGLSWVPAKSWRVTPQLTYVRNQSTIVINEYDRNMVSVAARLEF